MVEKFSKNYNTNANNLSICQLWAFYRSPPSLPMNQNQNPPPQNPIPQQPLQIVDPEIIALVHSFQNDQTIQRIHRAIRDDPILRNNFADDIETSQWVPISILAIGLLAFAGIELFFFIFGIEKKIFALPNMGISLGLNFSYQMINGLILEQCCKKSTARKYQVIIGFVGAALSVIFLIITITSSNETQTEESKFWTLFYSGICTSSGGILMSWIFAHFLVKQIKNYIRIRKSHNPINNEKK